MLSRRRLFLSVLLTLIYVGKVSTNATVTSTTTTVLTTTPMTCGDPPRVDSAAMTRLSDKLARYVCNSGRDMKGSSMIRCHDSEWSTPPQCIRLTCPEPPPSQNYLNSYREDSYHGWWRIRRRSDFLHVGSTVKYHCRYAWLKSGVSQTTCQSNLTWTPLNFQCKARDCGSVPELENGFNQSVTSTKYGGIITYKCNTGYFMETPYYRRRSEHKHFTYDVRCRLSWRYWGLTAVWSKLPKCLPLECGESPTVRHASKRVIGENIYQDTVVYECPHDYELIGNHSIICGEDAKWSTEPSCKLLMCPDAPSNVTKASMVSFTSHNFGGQAVYQCLKGYHTARPPSIVCKRNGEWSTYPQCNPIDCGTPPSIHFGSREYTTTTFGSNTTYVCEDHFEIIGIDYIRCAKNGEWEKTPLCEPISPEEGEWLKTLTLPFKPRSNSTEELHEELVILSIVFILLTILLIILTVALLKVYGYCGHISLLKLKSSSGILAKLKSLASREKNIAVSFAPDDLKFNDMPSTAT